TEHVAGRKRTREDVHHQRADMMCADFPAILVPGLHHCGDQIIRSVGSRVYAICDQAVEDGREFRERTSYSFAPLSPAVRRPCAVEKRVAPFHYLVVERVGYA